MIIKTLNALDNNGKAFFADRKTIKARNFMVQLRKARPMDFAQLLPLFRQLWPGKQINEKPFLDVFQRVLAADDRYYLCAVKGKRVVGLGSATFKDSLWQEGRIAHIEEIVVHEDLRGKGIGTQLLHQLICLARDAGCRRVELDSAFHRTEAHRFYERHGFENRAYLFSRLL